MSEQSNKTVEETYKSNDTEETIDIYFNRPIGFLWAKFFNSFGIHPNVVTILSMILGSAAGVMFYYNDLTHNIIGILLLMWANFYDSADGQLARMSGKRTLWGRMLDGLAGDVWFYVIYFCICLRVMPENIPFTSTPWGIWIWIVAAISGLICHTKQCQLSDYYRNIHLFFLKGIEGSELDNSEQQRQNRLNVPKKGNFWWRAFLWGYTGYTAAQEKMTPNFQKLIHLIKEERGGQTSEKFRKDFRKESFPLMKYTNMLTFNWRAITLYLSCLFDMPWIYFLVELTVFNVVLIQMNIRHERFSKRFYNEMKEGKY